jgi:hypothetical protein
MHADMILIFILAIILVCFWRAALALLLCATVGLILLGLVTAIGYHIH